MRTLTPVAFAEMAVSGSNDTVIVMDLHNAGGSSRWSQQFPSLDAEQLEHIDGVTFLTSSTRWRRSAPSSASPRTAPRTTPAA